MKTVVTILIAGLFASCTNTERQGTELDVRKTEDSTVQRPSAALNNDDADFIKEAMEESYREIKLAALASRKSTNAEVKRIASMLENDHNGSLQKLRALASNKSLAVQPVDSMDVLEDVDDMGKKTALKFDKEWCDEMSDAHEKKIKKFERASSTAMDADLRNWINESIPTLKRHYDELEACRKKM